MILVGLSYAVGKFIILVPMFVNKEWTEDGIALFLAVFAVRFINLIFTIGIAIGGIFTIRLNELGRKLSIYSCSGTILFTLTMLIIESSIFKTGPGEVVLMILYLFIFYGSPVIILTRPKVKEQFK